MQAFMPPGTVKSERRKKSRKRPLSLIYVELASGNGGMMRDLNQEGFAVRAMMPLRAGEIIPFSFSLDDSILIEGKGEILWIGEGGRVAGVRFTQISSTAPTQIQDWLRATSDSPKRQEAQGKPLAPPAPTLDQLREEIRSVPVGVEPRGAIHAAQAPSAPERAYVQQEVTTSAPPTDSSPSSPQTPASVSSPVASMPELPSISAAYSVLPSLPEILEEVDSSAEGVLSATESVYDALILAGSRNPFLSPPIRENKTAPPQAPSEQPDISKILMQPPGKTISYPPDSSPYEHLAVGEPVPQTPPTSWTEWFTLSRAVAIMILLTLVVAACAFHRQLGNSLIWLGEQIGGTQVSQFRERVPDYTVSTGIPVGSSSNPAESSSQQNTSAEPATAERQNAGGASALGNNPQPSLSTVAKSSLPPTSPLLGSSTPTASYNGQETGEPEYVQAIQLLRDRNAGADSSEAVGLLWISVEKGNPSAELTLADMYWHGQGIARNCDQARILLSAAARKGNAEAQKRLRQFQREGCE
ncbi:MAG: PilZ domain-containing protein [Candidatus Acidiferrum sp.]